MWNMVNIHRFWITNKVVEILSLGTLAVDFSLIRRNMVEVDAAPKPDSELPLRPSSALALLGSAWNELRTARDAIGTPYLYL